jgi:hypothetical protein
MSDIKVRILHPTDIALEDTAAYNQTFRAITTLRDYANKSENDDEKAQYTLAMNDLVSKVESGLSDDSTVIDIGPFLDAWEVEGGKSFAPFTEQMYNLEREEKMAGLVNNPTNLKLNKDQQSLAIQNVKDRKKSLDAVEAWHDEWMSWHDNANREMETLWSRYEEIKDVDPDNDWMGESRFVWWGLASPDNSIQEEIAALGERYRMINTSVMQAPLPEMIKANFNMHNDKYNHALTALEKLQGDK